MVVALAASALAVGTLACGGPDADQSPGGAGGSATSPASGASTATEPASTPSSAGAAPGGSTETATASLTATTAAPDPEAALRRSLLSSLTTGLDPASTRDALKDIEVVTAPLEAEGRTLRVAVTSGAGIYALPEAREHVAAIYEQSGNDWVELANITLGSGPTFAEIEVVADAYAGSSWIAVRGVTGAHSGTRRILMSIVMPVASAPGTRSSIAGSMARSWRSPSPGSRRTASW